MKRKQIVMLVVVALGAALVLVLGLRNRQPPVLPLDEDHVVYTGADACLACHGPGAEFAQSPNHPSGRECLRCHGRGR